MSLKIEVDVPYDEVKSGAAATYLASALSAIGYSRQSAQPTAPVVRLAEEDFSESLTEAKAIIDEAGVSTGAGASPLREEPKRERGKPAAGRARRTKEEIAEDEAADRADAARAEAAADANIQAVKADDVKASISTGENRVGPEDDPETEAQDAADEAAEAAAKREPGKVTHDDLRRAVGAYQKTHGMAAAVRLVGEGGLIGCTIDKVPEADLPAMIAKVEAATKGGVETTAEDPAKSYSRADVEALMVQYKDAHGMDAVQADAPRIFESALGAVPEGTTNAKGVVVSKWVLSAIPDDQESLAACVEAWTDAVEGMG